MRTLFAAGPGRHARPRRRAVAAAPRPPLPIARPGQEIGLGSRTGDTDWSGWRRVFTADADMGVWVHPNDFKEIA